MTQIVKKVTSKIFKKNISQKEFSEVEYQDEIVKMLLSESPLIEKHSLKNYINSIKELENFPIISAYSQSFENEFTDKIHTLFFKYSKTIEFLNIENRDRNNVLNKIQKCIFTLFEHYKQYLNQLITFYTNNEGFSYPLNCYPPSLLNVPFYDYIKKNPLLVNYNNETNTILQLELIHKIISARFLELKQLTKEDIIKNLNIFIKSKNKEIHEIASSSRDKLYKYNGIKCPNHLIYISIISEYEAEKLAKYTIKFFENETDVNHLKLALQGRLGIIPENNESLDDLYSSNGFMAKPLIIKSRKLGYISYIYDFLLDKAYITQDTLWKSISNHNYYKFRRKNNTIEFLSPNDFSKSLSHINRKVNLEEIQDNELISLKVFLKENFKN